MQTTTESARGAGSRSVTSAAVRLAQVSVFAFLGAIALLSRTEHVPAVDPAGLLPTLNLVFLTAMPGVVAWLAARDFRTSRSVAGLLLGCSMVALGTTNAVAAYSAAAHLGDNATVTVHNAGMLFAGVLGLASGLCVVHPGRVTGGRFAAAAAYAGVAGLVALIHLGERAGALPHFFVTGSGPTDVRQLVLASATAAFATTGVVFAFVHRRHPPAFVAWFSVGLAMVAVGLLGVFLQRALGSPVSWAGRIAQYVGCCYLFIGVLSLPRGSSTWSVSLEQLLLESQGLYRSVVDLCPDAILVHSGGVCRFANLSAAALFRAPSDAHLVGRELASFVAPDCLGDAGAVFGATAPGLRALKLRRLDGSEVPVELTSAAVTFRGEPAVQTVVRDVSGRLAAEEAGHRIQARFKLLSDTASLLLAAAEPQRVVDTLCRDVMVHLDADAFFNFLYDADSRKLRLNACAGIAEEDARAITWLEGTSTICGCAAAQCQRIVAEDIQHTDDPRANLVRSYGIAAYCSHPIVAEGRVLGTLSFGTRRRTRFSEEDLALMKTVTDQVAVAMDRVRSSDALTDANARLVEADRRKDAFLAMLSHELRNPLTPIRNSLYILRRAPPGTEQSERAQAVIERQVKHLAHLVDDLLDITRITRGKIQLKHAEFDLGELVRHTAEDHRVVFARAGIQFSCDAGAGVRVYADPNRIEQAIGNLLQNAAKFTPAGGRVAIALHVAEDGRASVRVRDSGVGIAPDVARRLFVPFVQADTTLDRSNGGLGLGLALVKALVEMHGGEVTFESDGPGKGAEFAIHLPMLQDEAQPATPTSSVA